MAHYVGGLSYSSSEEEPERLSASCSESRQHWERSRRARICDCADNDLNVEMGLSFLRGITKPGETVLFSCIVFKSRAHRDRVNAKVMKAPRMLKMMKSAPMSSESGRTV